MPHHATTATLAVVAVLCVIVVIFFVSSSASPASASHAGAVPPSDGVSHVRGARRAQASCGSPTSTIDVPSTALGEALLWSNNGVDGKKLWQGSGARAFRFGDGSNNGRYAILAAFDTEGLLSASASVVSASVILYRTKDLPDQQNPVTTSNWAGTGAPARIRVEQLRKSKPNPVPSDWSAAAVSGAVIPAPVITPVDHDPENPEAVVSIVELDVTDAVGSSVNNDGLTQLRMRLVTATNMDQGEDVMNMWSARGGQSRGAAPILRLEVCGDVSGPTTTTATATPSPVDTVSASTTTTATAGSTDAPAPSQSSTNTHTHTPAPSPTRSPVPSPSSSGGGDGSTRTVTLPCTDINGEALLWNKGTSYKFWQGAGDRAFRLGVESSGAELRFVAACPSSGVVGSGEVVTKATFGLYQTGSDGTDPLTASSWAGRNHAADVRLSTLSKRSGRATQSDFSTSTSRSTVVRANVVGDNGLVEFDFTGGVESQLNPDGSVYIRGELVLPRHRSSGSDMAFFWGARGGAAGGKAPFLRVELASDGSGGGGGGSAPSASPSRTPTRTPTRSPQPNPSSDPSPSSDPNPCSVDSDGDGTNDCDDGCPSDRSKTSPGNCGCGKSESSCATAVKPRVVVLTDIGLLPKSDEKDKDDIQSLVRFLLYSNEFDVEGLIATAAWHGTIKNQVPSVHPDTIFQAITAYGKVRGNLVKHASGYPTVSQLRSVVKTGVKSTAQPFFTGDHMRHVGTGKSTAASNHIISVVDKSDSRPVWFLGWGKMLDLAQALGDVARSRSSAALKKFTSKIRVYDIAGQDNAGAAIAKQYPDILYLRSLRQFKALSYLGGDTSMFQSSWYSSHITGHGALSAFYPGLDTSHSVVEGDTPSFLFLLPNGLSSFTNPAWGGWGGRFKNTLSKNPRVNSQNDAKYQPYYMYTEASDSGSSNMPIQRFRAHLQWDFAARMDWCKTSSYSGANHAPTAVVAGAGGTTPVYLNLKAGSTHTLSGAGTSDPDGDGLTYYWWRYDEPDSYSGSVTIASSTSRDARVQLPSGAKGKTVHIIFEVKDRGSPNLRSYRRVVITGT